MTWNDIDFRRAVTGDTQAKVAYILARDVMARNDDWVVLWEFYRLFDQAVQKIGEGGVEVLTKDVFIQRTTSTETILRAKRYIQNTQKMYQPMPHIKEKREQEAMKFREKYAPKKDQEKVVEGLRKALTKKEII